MGFRQHRRAGQGSWPAECWEAHGPGESSLPARAPAGTAAPRLPLESTESGCAAQVGFVCFLVCVLGEMGSLRKVGRRLSLVDLMYAFPVDVHVPVVAASQSTEAQRQCVGFPHLRLACDLVGHLVSVPRGVRLGVPGLGAGVRGGRCWPAGALPGGGTGARTCGLPLRRCWDLRVSLQEDKPGEAVSAL